MPQVESPPTPPTPPGAGKIVIPAGVSPREMYRALNEQRSELREQLNGLQERRSDLARQIEETQNPVAKKGLEEQLTSVDQRIAALDKQLADADQAVARAAGIPGAIIPQPRVVRDEGPPEEVVAITIVFILAVMMPLSIAFARRIWKRSSSAVAQIPAEIFQRLERMEHGMDAIALEIERIGEGQRFTNRLFSERAIPAGAAQPMEVKAGEKAPAPRTL